MRRTAAVALRAGRRGAAADAALASAADDGDAHARRLAEMQAASNSKRSLPSVQEVAASLHARTRADVPTRPPDAAPPPRDWRNALEAAREAGLGADPLVDSFGRRHTYLRVSLTERCNLRCTYCMPPDGVALTEREDLLSSGEVLRLTSLFARHGVTKVRLTGGEPTLRPDLESLAASISSLPSITSLGITTNGVALARRVPGLVAAGVSLWNVSLDSLQADRFERITRRRGHASVLSTLDALASSLPLSHPVKVNAVIVRGVNDGEIGDFVRLALDRGINARFIEAMPFHGNGWSSNSVVPYKELLASAQAAAVAAGAGGLVPAAGAARDRLAGSDGDSAVAKDWVFASPPPSASPHASVSFVTSMTDAFCGSCNRVRLLADGALKVCLFGGAEVSLRDALRGGASDDDVASLVALALAGKKAAHAGMDVLAAAPNRAMVRIGG